MFYRHRIGCIDLHKCSNKKPEQIGKQVFAMLKNLDSDNSQTDYLENFLSTKEINVLGTDQQIVKSEKTRQIMTSMTKEKWQRRLERSYDRVKEKGKKFKIIWKNIKYIDFVCQIKEQEGIKGCEGDLRFKANGILFAMEIVSIFNGHEYRLIRTKAPRLAEINNLLDTQ